MNRRLICVSDDARNKTMVFVNVIHPDEIDIEKRDFARKAKSRFSLKLPLIGFLFGFACQNNLADRHANRCDDHIEERKHEENDESVSCRGIVLADEKKHDGNVGKKAEKMQCQSQPKGELLNREELKGCGKNQRKNKDLCQILEIDHGKDHFGIRQMQDRGKDEA